MKKILILGSQHGNELIGIRLYEYLHEKHPDIVNYVDYHCANPAAFALGRRFIDTDLNRSYAHKHHKVSYEQHLAANLLKHLAHKNYDYIIDCHTTTTDMGLCLIVPNITDMDILKVINRAPSIRHIIHLPQSITKHSLIGNVEKCVSLECNDNLATQPGTLETLAQFIKNLCMNIPQSEEIRYIYHVTEYVSPGSMPTPLPKNYQIVHGNYYVLVGGNKKERTYSGFLADKRSELEI